LKKEQFFKPQEVKKGYFSSKGTAATQVTHLLHEIFINTNGVSSDALLALNQRFSLSF